MFQRSVFAALGLIALTAAWARAEDPGFFPRGTWAATGYGTYVKSFTGEEAKMGSGSVGIGYYVFDNVSITAEFSGYYDSQPGPDAQIYAGDLVLRGHLFHSGRFSFFGDALAGISYADERVPASGTYYNYNLALGVGATFQLYDNLHLIGGVRYFHISNAHLEGPLRNPSINATQAYVGLLFKF
ncbi:MAG TPA: acyloxyacyl hydrolase [Tepidisphaeraceae bacterium]|jgi:hypothetical protein